MSFINKKYEIELLNHKTKEHEMFEVSATFHQESQVATIHYLYNLMTCNYVDIDGWPKHKRSQLAATVEHDLKNMFECEV